MHTHTRARLVTSPGLLEMVTPFSLGMLLELLLGELGPEPGALLHADSAEHHTLFVCLFVRLFVCLLSLPFVFVRLRPWPVQLFGDEIWLAFRKLVLSSQVFLFICFDSKVFALKARLGIKTYFYLTFCDCVSFRTKKQSSE